MRSLALILGPVRYFNYTYIGKKSQLEPLDKEGALVTSLYNA